MSQTALHMAADFDSSGGVGLLLDNRADIDLEDSKRQTPLFIACAKGKNRAAQVLIERGADANAVSLVLAASRSNNRGILKMLLESGAPPLNTRVPTMNFIREAVDNERWESVRVLMQYESFKHIGQLRSDLSTNFMVITVAKIDRVIQESIGHIRNDIQYIQERNQIVETQLSVMAINNSIQDVTPIILGYLDTGRSLQKMINRVRDTKVFQNKIKQKEIVASLNL